MLSTSSPLTPLQNQSSGTKRNLTDYPTLPPSSPTSLTPCGPLNDSNIQSLTGRSPLPFVTSLIPLIALHHPGHSMICMLELSHQQAFEDFTLGMVQRFFSSHHLLGYSMDSSSKQPSMKTSGTTLSSTSLNPSSCPPPCLLPLPPQGTCQPNAPPLHRMIFHPSLLTKSRSSQTSSTKTPCHVRSPS